MGHTSRDPIQNRGQEAVKDSEAFLENVTLDLSFQRGGKDLIKRKDKGWILQQNSSCAKSRQSQVHSGNCQRFSGIWACGRGEEAQGEYLVLVCPRLPRF